MVMKFNRLMVDMAAMWVRRGNRIRRKDFIPFDTFKHTLDINYNNDKDYHHNFDIFFAKEKRKNICIIDIHGGAYITGDHRDNFFFGCHFLNEGFDFISIDYSLNNGKIGTKDQIDDCYKCLSYINEHKKELGLENDSFVITGDSAGGHFALIMALAFSSREYANKLGYDLKDLSFKGVLLNCPVYDFTNLSSSLSKSGAKRMFGPLYNDIEYKKLICPKENIKYLSIPLFLSTCKRDFIGIQSKLLKDDLDKMNYKFDYCYIDSDENNVAHVHNVLDPLLDASKEVNNRMIAFIDNL